MARQNILNSTAAIIPCIVSNNVFKVIFVCWCCLSLTTRWWRGQDSRVDIATHYGLDGPGFEPGCGQGICSTPYLFRPALGPTQPPLQWIQWLSWGWSDQGVVLSYTPSGTYHLCLLWHVMEWLLPLPRHGLPNMSPWEGILYLMKLANC